MQRSVIGTKTEYPVANRNFPFERSPISTTKKLGNPESINLKHNRRHLVVRLSNDRTNSFERKRKSSSFQIDPKRNHISNNT